MQTHSFLWTSVIVKFYAAENLNRSFSYNEGKQRLEEFTDGSGPFRWFSHCPSLGRQTGVLVWCVSLGPALTQQPHCGVYRPGLSTTVVELWCRLWCETSCRVNCICLSKEASIESNASSFIYQLQIWVSNTQLSFHDQ